LNGTCLHSSPRASDSMAHSSIFTQIRSKFRNRSFKHFQRRLDHNCNTHSVNVEGQNESFYDNRHRTSSLRLPRSKHNGVLKEQCEPETSDSESYLSGYGSLSGSYPSSNTISCQISYNDLKQCTESRDNETPSNAITHF
jgi:hypothetical protein